MHLHAGSLVAVNPWTGDFLLGRLREGCGYGAMTGTPKFIESQTLPDIDYDIAPAWDNALSANRPTLLDVRCDPNLPPIPPHATFEQMTDAAKTLLAGDEDRWDVIGGREDQTPGIPATPHYAMSPTTKNPQGTS